MDPAVQPDKRDLGGQQGVPPLPAYAPQSYNYGPSPGPATSQQPASAMYTTQTNVLIVPQPYYKDYLGCSITTMLLCCLPIGIAALVFSCKTKDSMNRGDMTSAASDSRMAFTLNMVALGVGIGLHLIWILYLIIASAVLGSAVSHYYG